MFMNRMILGFVLITAAILSVARPASPVAAADINVAVTSTENKWPTAILFNVEASGANDIKSITMNYSWGRGNVSNVARATFDPGKNVKTQIQIKTAAQAYVPPFSEMKYTVTAEDTTGATSVTDSKSFIYEDGRFKWTSVQSGLLTVYYYGGNKSTADQVMEAATQVLDDDFKSFGVKVTEPLKIVLYNKKPDIDGALPFESAATQRDLVIEGQAHSEYNLVLVLDDQSVIISTRHELTHVVTNLAAGNAFTEIPFWLNEGLSVFVQGNQGAEYQPYLKMAIAQNKLISIRNLTAKPGKADDVLLGYGEGYEIVKYLVQKYGPEKMAAFLAAYKQGTTDDNAMKSAYGFDRDQLEKEWRASIGATAPAARATPANGSSAQPRATPVPVEDVPVSSPSESGNALPLLILGIGGVFGCLITLGFASFLITLAVRRR